MKITLDEWLSAVNVAQTVVEGYGSNEIAAALGYSPDYFRQRIRPALIASGKLRQVGYKRSGCTRMAVYELLIPQAEVKKELLNVGVAVSERGSGRRVSNDRQRSKAAKAR